MPTRTFSNEFLKLEGTAFGSSVGDAIEFMKLSLLNEEEKTAFSAFNTRELKDLM